MVLNQELNYHALSILKSLLISSIYMAGCLLQLQIDCNEI